ncbi:MAG: type II secretion system F family protein [Bradyrhizobium sp.]|nr:MAG: type II secretion system F family protein [Bradyrhizobium sp.]
MISNTVLAAGLAIVSLGGVAFVFTGGNSRAESRRASLSKPEQKVNLAADRAAKKKQMSDSLKDLEKKSQRKGVSLTGRLEQAGLPIDKRQFIMISIGAGVAVTGFTFIKSGSPIMALLFGVIAGLGLPNLVLSRLRKRRINKFIDIFPNALDIIVRGVKAGLPLGDCLRIVSNECPEPVRGEFRKIVESVALGLPLDEAAEKMAERVPVSETNFFSIVIGIQLKAGGNLSEAIGNLSRTLRERKKMKGKIKAMAMEANASAAIIGAVPFVVTTLLYLSSPKYISLLWSTQHGRVVAAIACFWMSIGIVMMRKMIAFDF